MKLNVPFIDFSGDLTLYWACAYLSLLGLKLHHVSKRGYWAIFYVEPIHKEPSDQSKTIDAAMPAIVPNMKEKNLNLTPENSNNNEAIRNCFENITQCFEELCKQQIPLLLAISIEIYYDKSREAPI